MHVIYSTATMPRYTRPERVLDVLDTATGSATAIAEIVAVPRKTVADLLKRYAPVAEELRDVKTGWLKGMWQSVVMGALGKLHEAAHSEPEQRETKQGAATYYANMNASDLKSWAIVAGIGTEKVQLLDGRPTSIGAVWHEHRHDVSAIADKLSRLVNRQPSESPIAGIGDQIARIPTGNIGMDPSPEQLAPPKGSS